MTPESQVKSLYAAIEAALDQPISKADLFARLNLSSRLALLKMDSAIRELIASGRVMECGGLLARTRQAVQ